MKRLLDLKEISRVLGTHPSTIRRFIHDLGLPCYRVGGRLLFDEEEVQVWIKNHKVKNQIEARIFKRELQNRLTKSSTVIIEEEKGASMPRGKTKARYFSYGYGNLFTRITKTGETRWYIDYTTQQKERIQKVVPHATSKSQALQTLKEVILADLEKNDYEEKRFTSFTAMSQHYLETYAVSKRSYQTDEFRLRKLKEFFKDKELRKIKPSMIREYVAMRLKEGKTESTVNRELALLKKMFSLAIEDGYLEENPAKKIKKFSEYDTERDRVLSEEEEKRLLSELPDRVKPVVIVALHTGLRLSEVLGLKWSGVDMDTRFIKVERTKSKKTRFISINSLLYEELAQLKKQAGKEQRVFAFKSIRTAFDNACKRAQVKDFTFHDLRRTFGTRLLEKGVDIMTISKLYGHSNVLVTQRYLHPKDRLSVEAVELLAERPVKSDQPCDTSVTFEEQSDVIH